MSLITKQNGAIYTPPSIVKIILDETLPKSSDEFSHTTICDIACGDGAFLTEFAHRVLSKLVRDKALQVLRRMEGYDIDDNAIEKCKIKLDRVLNNWYPYEKVDWKITHRDALHRPSFERAYGKFTHIVGNPPYVRVQHLGQDRRDQAAGKWKLLRGATDLYIIFFELALDLLQDGGTVGYITPSSWLRSGSGALLRKYLVNSHRVKKIIDFGEHQIFNEVTTYTAITIVQKGGQNAQHIPAVICDGKTVSNGGSVIMNRAQPENAWWIAHNDSDIRRMSSLMQRSLRLKDVADIHVGIQTLADSVFILPIKKSRQLLLETWVLRDIVKVSTMQNGQDALGRVIIFPYEDGKLLPEEYISYKAPNVYRWLLSHKKRLLSRDKGKLNTEKWYGFGRQVSIVSGFGEKILISGMNKYPNFQRCKNPSATFYSGYCIKPKQPEAFSWLISSLNSDDMNFFIRCTSRPYQGGWMSYAKSFIENFPLQFPSEAINQSLGFNLNRHSFSENGVVGNYTGKHGSQIQLFRKDKIY